jgi:hypothetical protein
MLPRMQSKMNVVPELQCRQRRRGECSRGPTKWSDAQCERGEQLRPDQVVRRAARERDSEQPRMQCKLSTDGNVLCIHVQNEMSRQRSQKGVLCVIHRPEHDVCVQQSKTER